MCSHKIIFLFFFWVLNVGTLEFQSSGKYGGFGSRDGGRFGDKQ